MSEILSGDRVFYSYEIEGELVTKPANITGVLTNGHYSLRVILDESANMMDVEDVTENEEATPVAGTFQKNKPDLAAAKPEPRLENAEESNGANNQEESNTTMSDQETTGAEAGENQEPVNAGAAGETTAPSAADQGEANTGDGEAAAAAGTENNQPAE